MFDFAGYDGLLFEYFENLVEDLDKSIFIFVAGFSWKFVPSKFTRPPKEFRIYGNETRQTLLDNFLVPIEEVRNKKKTSKRLYQSRITKFFK